MLSRDIRRALSKLGSGDSSVRRADADGGDEPHVATPAEPAGPFLSYPPLIFPRGEGADLVGTLGGAERVTASGLPYWHIDVEVAEVWPRCADRLRTLSATLGAGDEPDGLPPAFELLARHGADACLFLDIETGGLWGNPVFLVGVLELGGGGPVLRFFLARDLEEEIPLLEAFDQHWRRFGCLVTYNGRSFDAPFLTNRMTYWRIRGRPPADHVDLLHLSRRLLRGDFPNFRLRTLEEMMLGRGREDDIPSAEVPAVFHEFTRSREPALLAPILQHNAVDLVTLAELLARHLERL